MYFTKSSQTFRGWFHVQTSLGTLRTGALGDDFVVTIVTADDLGSHISHVTESTQKPGLYYFNIPTSFLVVSGVGSYGISVETNIDEYPSVFDCKSHVLNVTQNDVDSLSGSMWSTSAAAFNVSGSMGWLQNRNANLDVAVSTRAVPGDQMTLSYATLQQVISGVWNVSDSGLNVSGTTGWHLNKLSQISSSVEAIRNVEFGRWIITGSQQVMYDQQGNELVRFNLLKSDGTAFVHDTAAVVERVPTGSA